MVGCLQRFHGHQSAVRPAGQCIDDRHRKQRPSPEPAIRWPLMARAPASPSMTNTMLAYRPNFSARYLRPPAFSRHGCHAPLRSGRRPYAFSYIGYNGTMAGGGDTEDSRWDDAVKYRITYGPVHFGAMYKLADGSGGCYGGFLGAGLPRPVRRSRAQQRLRIRPWRKLHKFSADAVFQHFNQAISVLNPLLGPQSLRRRTSPPPTASIPSRSPGTI